MPAVFCTMMVGLFCVTASEGQARHVASLAASDSWVAPDYTVEFVRSDFFSPYDLKDHVRLCRQKDCRRFKITVRPSCAIGFSVFEATADPSGLDNHGYSIRARSLAGLKRGLAETYLSRRKGRDDYVSLAELVGADLDAVSCP